MGANGYLTIGEYPVVESRNDVIAEAMTVFRETDRRVVNRRVTDLNPLVWNTSNPNGMDTVRMVEYACQTSRVIDRLEVMGFTLSRARVEFEAQRQEELKALDSDAERRGTENWYTDDRPVVRSLTFDVYTAALAEIMSSRLNNTSFQRDAPAVDQDSQTALVEHVQFLRLLGPMVVVIPYDKSPTAEVNLETVKRNYREFLRI